MSKRKQICFYTQGINELKKQDYQILAIVCDGRKRLLQSFENIPVQMCQFHQVAIIRRYIAKNLKLSTSIDFKALITMMKMTDKESFEGSLELWYIKWRWFLNECTINPETGKSYYTHKPIKKCLQKPKNKLKRAFLLGMIT